MIKNNVIALGILFMMDVIMIGLTGLSDWSLSFLHNPILAVIDAILTIIMVALFIFFGKKFLKNQGLKIENLLSVSFIFVLGIGEAFHYTNLNQNIPGNIDLFSSRFVPSCVASVIPSLLMLVGIELGKKRDDRELSQ